MENSIENEDIRYYDVVKYLDINEGDLLVVASDVTRLFFAEFTQTGDMPDINKLIDSFKDKVGIKGTLLFPMYNWDFCKGVPFDIRTTPGKTGALGNAALKRSDFKRVKHPLYSFMVWGKHADYLANMTNIDSWGEGSVFDFLHHNEAKWLLFDVNVTYGYSFIHHVEQMGHAPYRYNKFFTAEYTNEEGVTDTRRYSMYVRNLDLNPIENFGPIEQELIQKGIAQKTIINDIPYTIVDVARSYEPILNDVVNNRSRKIYKYKGQD